MPQPHQARQEGQHASHPQRGRDAGRLDHPEGRLQGPITSRPRASTGYVAVAEAPGGQYQRAVTGLKALLAHWSRDREPPRSREMVGTATPKSASASQTRAADTHSPTRPSRRLPAGAAGRLTSPRAGLVGRVTAGSCSYPGRRPRRGPCWRFRSGPRSSSVAPRPAGGPLRPAPPSTVRAGRLLHSSRLQRLRPPQQPAGALTGHCLTGHCLTGHCLTGHCLTGHCLTGLWQSRRCRTSEPGAGGSIPVSRPAARFMI